MSKRIAQAFLLVSVSSVIGLTGCQSRDSIVTQGAALQGHAEVAQVTPPQSPQPPQAPSHPGGPVVCDPSNGGGSHQSPNQGLIAQLWNVTGLYDELLDVSDYQRPCFKTDATLYFNQLNIPTRIFRDGFPTQDGSVLKTPRGDKLIEYFSLRFNSVLKLSPEQEAGEYQLAILADDGAVVRIGKDQQKQRDDEMDASEWEAFDKQGYRVLIDNDGHHASRLECARNGIKLGRDSRFPLQVDYFQGPRYHMALMLLWRKLPEHGHCAYEPACGRSGNDEFFDAETIPSTPEPLWIQMLSRGWKVVGSDNFMLPDGAPSNPCLTPGPSPTPSTSPVPSPVPSDSPLPVPSQSPTPVPSASPSPTVTPSPTPSFIPPLPS